MAELPVTQPSLIFRLADGCDRQAWQQFVEIYAPLVFNLARQRGLQEADAADVTQDVLSRVADAFRRGTFDRSRGTFRGWLFTIARHEIADCQSARGRPGRAAGGTTMGQMLAEVAAPADEPAWEAEYQQRLFQWAARRVQSSVKPEAWECFWQTAVAGESKSAVAARLGVTVAYVYLWRSRVLARLREMVREIDDELTGLSFEPDSKERNA
jgi:RNA polymerase sigma-70 factor (ECF subfamily)